jgi:CMP-N,N'-diacetyllegionaminic acid synthase
MPQRPTITAIIPARAGSKGIPGKNLWTYEGVSLLARAIRLGQHCSGVERVIVSTDSAEMQAIAIAEGADAPRLRPSHLAGDAATSAAVVKHVVEDMAVASDHLLLLQVTSPLRTLGDCDAFLDAYFAAKAPASTSIVKLDEPRPEKLKKLEQAVLQPYLYSHYEGPRQALPQPFALNGAFYAIARDVFMREGKFLPEGTTGFEMPPERSHNLDSKQDLQVLDAMLKAGHWRFENLPANLNKS